MKKNIIIIFLMLLSTVSVLAETISFSDALSQSGKTPALVLIHATWATNSQSCLSQFKRIQNEYGNRFNYVELDVASPDMALFNQKYQLLQGVPYMLMIRNNGTITRNVTTDCINDYSCLNSRVKTFVP